MSHEHPLPPLRPPGEPTRIVRESRYTCASCGHEWHHGPADDPVVPHPAPEPGAPEATDGASLPRILIPAVTADELNVCPKCGSPEVTREVLEHRVP